jgi:predicted membrane-bound spermidine synthase
VRTLYPLVFTTGLVTLGMELSAARLLEPAFGNNQLVWAALIGLILLYLAVGAWLGGWLADRFPRRRELDLVATAAAVGVAAIPLFSPPVLRLAATGLEHFAPGLLAGALFAVLLLFSVPGILLGTITPWAVRLAVRDLQQAGQTAGRISAVATAGSLVGAFLPALWLIPAYGTRWTFYLLALLLLVVVSVGALQQTHRWLPLLMLLVVLLLALTTPPGSPIRAAWDDGRTGHLIYEDESRYNYIAVRQWGSERHLKLNDGVGIHSVYHPESVLSLGIWDYFLLAPLFGDWRLGDWVIGRLETDSHPITQSPNLLLIGLAAGTVSELYTDLYGPIPITGVELDPQIIAVGQRYFGMNQPNLTAVAADGRHWLAQQPDNARWSIIAIDAYRPPYIPFHLTTVEFFTLVRAHLPDEGVVAINVGRTATNYALVDALAVTLAQVFPAVYALDEPGPGDNLSNTLLFATVQPIEVATVRQRAATLPATLPVEFRDFAQRATAQIRLIPQSPNAPVFTDDHAPVEWVVHRIIWEFMRGG